MMGIIITAIGIAGMLVVFLYQKMIYQGRIDTLNEEREEMIRHFDGMESIYKESIEKYRNTIKVMMYPIRPKKPRKHASRRMVR